MATLRLQIKLGNEATQYPALVAESIYDSVCRELHRDGFPERSVDRPIKDANGNTVGYWRVSPR